MKPVIIAALLVSGVAAPATANKSDRIIAANCETRGLLTAEGCACLQRIADDDFRQGLHELLAEHLAKKVNVAEIAAERGHSGAEALWDAHRAFHDKASKQCDLPHPAE